MRTWTLSLVLFATALGGLSKAKADDDGDYWRYRHHRWQDGYGDRDDWRYRHHRWHDRDEDRDRWRYGDDDRDHWRHRHHHHNHDDEGGRIVIPVPPFP
jgi:hypothetical protein